MALFQTSVLSKYLNIQDDDVLRKAYKKHVKYFQNPTIQQNIHEIKEEGFQQKFLIELFVNVLGFVINPDPKYNLSTEFKNEKGAKKADGAILADGKALAVIELKGTKTKDLESIRQQAFDYKANQTGCVYVITSNFEKLRFYINNAVEFEEFNLFTLTKTQFELLYLCLHQDNLLNNIPLQIKEESIAEEEKITKTFYTDYSVFKRELYRDLVKQNAKRLKSALRNELNEIALNSVVETELQQLEKNLKRTLFKKSQKLIDRFLFVFFAEDRDLLPPNSIIQILKKWKDDMEFGDERPLYNLFKQYFNFLNSGREKVGKRAEIYAYNGGLFKPDAILDSLLISDDLIYKHTKTLANYDFESQVGVTILGHIFENSLNEIESVNAEIEGTDFDKQKTKRKKDGVFYTPKYITKYIVDNTVGKLCNEKKEELKIVEEEFHPKRQKETKKKLLAVLESYRSWLLKLTILDPACGSGAFLNQALDFLIKEHGYIDELQTNLLGGGFVFPNIENTVLENNIFGVDLNEESVEIAKLSLWLRTAQPRRKLNDLSSNIKCGNSLIDDPKVAGDKAFKWEKEFAHIFPEKEKKAWHVTTATHNSRYSQRMYDNHIKVGEAVWLNENDEILITKTVAEIVKKDKLNVIEYNICGDHMHILLVCEENELTSIVGKLKAVSGRKYNIEKGITIVPATSITRGHVPLSDADADEKKEKKKYNSLWTQKFGKSEIKDENYLSNAIEYIKHNRVKHELPKSKEIEKLKKEFLCSYNHAFRTEYKGGFDVVIGNPPYVNINTLPKDIHQYFRKEYGIIHTGYNDLMYYFLYKGIKMLKKEGIFGVITSNYFIGNEYAKTLRGFLSVHVSEILNFGDYLIFEDANVHTTIIFAEKDQRKKTVKYGGLKNTKESLLSIEPNRFDTIIKDRDSLNEYWIFASKGDNQIIEKIATKGKLLGQIAEIEKGSTSGKNDVFTVSKEIVAEYNLENEILRKNVKNGDILKYGIHDRETFLIYTDSDTEIEKYPNILNYFNKHKDVLSNRNEVKKGSYDWWRMERPRRKEVYDANEKIIVPYRATNNRFAYDNERRFNDGGDIRVLLITDEDFQIKYVLGVLNSNLLNWYYGFIGKPKGNAREYFNEPLAKIPICLADNKIQTSIVLLVDSITEKLEKALSVQSKFTNYLQSQFSIERLPKKLQNWHELEFGEFIKELNKAIKKVGGEKLSKMDEMEWMEVFETKKAEAQTLKTEIDKTDKEIDAMVYELYGLSEEEIGIVEN